MNGFNDGEDMVGPTGNESKMHLQPEHARHTLIEQIKYSPDALSKTPVVILGANPLSEEIIKQLLVFGFPNVSIWDSERTSKGSSRAAIIMKKWSHLSPYHRNAKKCDSLENRAITAGLDALGFSMFRQAGPCIVINTMNNSYIADVMAERSFRDSTGKSILYIDAHTIRNHKERKYGLTLQAMMAHYHPLYDIYKFIEERDLSLYDNQEHDPLMAVICASYVGSVAARFALDMGSVGSSAFFSQPLDISIFPFTDSPLVPARSSREVHYRGFFRDKKIYVAGLGGGSLALDLLIRLFDAENIVGADRDSLERSNFNRLVPFAYERLIGKRKTEAADIVYAKKISLPGRKIRFVNGTIHDSLLIDEDEARGLDLIVGMLSGFNNKLNLAAICQRMASEGSVSDGAVGKRALIDIGVEPFRADITPYVLGKTPCDHCRNLHDLAVTDYFAGNIPECDRFPQGSTVFANYLGCALALVQAMKHFQPEYGRLASHSVIADLFPSAPNPALLYNHMESGPVDARECIRHCSKSPLSVDQSLFEIIEGHELGHPVKDVYRRPAKGSEDKAQHIGRFRYIPTSQQVHQVQP